MRLLAMTVIAGGAKDAIRPDEFPFGRVGRGNCAFDGFTPTPIPLVWGFITVMNI